MVGPSARHGPHQGAQKSTSTGCSLFKTSLSQFAVLNSLTISLAMRRHCLSREIVKLFLYIPLLLDCGGLTPLSIFRCAEYLEDARSPTDSCTHYRMSNLYRATRCRDDAFAELDGLGSVS